MKKINFIDLPSEETPINAKNLNEMQDNIEQAIAVEGVAGDTLPIGSVVEFASDAVIPENWLLCNGQEVSRTEYNLLFAVIGTTWGEGDGSTTFNVPTKEGLVTVGKTLVDSDFNFLGKTGGEKTHTLTVNEMPTHRHNRILTKNDSWTVGDGNGLGGTDIDAYTVKLGSTSLEQNQELSHYQTNNAGGSQPHNNLQPYVTSNFIIKAKQSSGVVATVVDSLGSNSATDALSAKQGKELNEKIEQRITTGIEFATNEWIDEKRVYRKRINCGALPNTTYSYIDTGMLYDNVTIIKIEGMGNQTTDGQYFPLPLVNVEKHELQIAITLMRHETQTEKMVIRITTGIDRSAVNGIVDIYYTKN